MQNWNNLYFPLLIIICFSDNCVHSSWLKTRHLRPSSSELKVVFHLWSCSEWWLAAPIGWVRILRISAIREQEVRRIQEHCPLPIILWSMWHQHDRLESTRLSWPCQRHVVTHKARVDLSLIHGAGVHIGRLLQEFQLLGGQCKGQATQNYRVKECDDSKNKSPAYSTCSKLEVICL